MMRANELEDLQNQNHQIIEKSNYLSEELQKREDLIRHLQSELYSYSDENLPVRLRTKLDCDPSFGAQLELLIFNGKSVSYENQTLRGQRDQALSLNDQLKVEVRDAKLQIERLRQAQVTVQQAETQTEVEWKRRQEVTVPQFDTKSFEHLRENLRAD